MTRPWKRGKRHESWASNTKMAWAALAIVFLTYVVWSIVAPPAPTGITTLLGVAGGALFGAVTDEKRRQEYETRETADRAETVAERAEVKVDKLTEVAEQQHPGSTRGVVAEGGEQQ